MSGLAAAALFLAVPADPASAESSSSTQPAIDAYGRTLAVDDRAVNVAWSPDGSRLAYTQQAGENASSIFLLDLNTGRTKLLVPEKKAVDFWLVKVGERFTEVAFSAPTFSPDGRYLAYQETATRWVRLDALGSLQAVATLYRQTIIRDLETDNWLSLDAAAKLKNSFDFVWGADSRSGYLQSVAKGRYGQTISRKVKFDLVARSATAKSSWRFSRTSSNGQFAAAQKAYRTQVYIVNTVTGAKIGKVGGVCRFDSACVSFINSDGNSYWRQLNNWTSQTCTLIQQDSRTNAVIKRYESSCASAMSADANRFLVRSGEGFTIAAVESLRLPPLTACPKTRDESPAVYDACWKDFVAPTVRLVGKPDCRLNPSSGVNVIAQWELVGGNYRRIRWQSTSVSWWYSANPGDSFPLPETFPLYVNPAAGYTGELRLEIEGSAWITLENCHW